MSEIVQLAVENPVSKLTAADGPASRIEATLNKIAATLGCSVSAFSEPPSGSIAETAELLELWALIQSERDRAKVLAFMRSAGVPTALKKAAE